MRKLVLSYLILPCLALSLIMLYPAPSEASNEIDHYVPHAAKVGEGRLDFALWPIYQATLYAPQGQWHPDKPFALTLSYLTKIPGKKIAAESIKEIRRQGVTDEIKLAAWYEQMAAIFPDVKKGSSLTGISTADGKTLFFSDDKPIGQIDNAEFSHSFFSIWLGPYTQSPSLRVDLLGMR